ncbi:MAG: sigma 54-interacting transcriptional regulator, partial [Planctomycetota bacterium]
GEPGSGRQALAEAAHAAGSRRAEPFMLSSGVGSSPTYQELEVLGYLRHTFINSIQNEPGVLERAEDGTALIRLGDDAAPGLLQTLAEAIANGWLRRVGCTVERPARARLILAVETATPDLVAFVRVTEAAVFRVPPLRERLEDLPLLIPALTPGLTRVGARRLERLAAHTWPGNLPELQSVLARIATRASTADPALGAGP